ncbi:hypothetical protein PanWU01x14_063170 [Parasponia andersonii]|uniref:Uncharacterized protein n=1 Tax=Parasponia andersonii TaxID=3476 RepID=A0A2P5DHS7_PARAD|nr:hypothetical protein PanWU01x14_063170 [Parasponia andersonii]
MSYPLHVKMLNTTFWVLDPNSTPRLCEDVVVQVVAELETVSEYGQGYRTQKEFESLSK